MRSRSLARQTLGIVLATQLLCGLVLCGAALLNERATRLRAFDGQLRGRADSLLGAIQDAEDSADNVAVDTNEFRPDRGDVYAVYTQGGRLLGASQDAPPGLIERSLDGFREVRVFHRKYRVYQREALRVIDRAETGGVGLRRPVTILYAAPEGHVWHEIVEAAQFYLVTIILATLATAVIVTLLLRRVLAPLADLAAQAGRLSAPSLEFEAPPSVWRVRELQPLAGALTTTVASLRKAFETEQQFFGDAAHELKTAVAVARSSLQVLMLRERSGAEYRAGLERVLEDNSRLETLVGQMLRLASVERQKREEDSAIDLVQLVPLVCRELSPIADERGVLLDIQVTDQARVRLSLEHGRSLVSNLVLNAIQHSPCGSTVTVLAKVESGQMRLQVIDRGRGIRPESLPHVYGRFYREDPSRSRETGGTGLGLSICKAIVDAAGGSIEIASEVGVGTTVNVVFTQN